MAAILTMAFFHGVPSYASTISADMLTISTMSGQATSNGISFSSAVVFGSGGSLTLSGSGGYVVGQSSVGSPAASALFGDGSHLSATNVTLSATNTFVGANAFTSTFTVQSGGREILLETSGVGKSIDISSAGVLTFFPQMHNSAAASLAEYSTSISSYGPCVTGSTITLFTSGGRVEVYFSGALISLSTTGAGPNSYYSPGASFLIDGNFVNDMTQHKGFQYDWGFFGAQFVAGYTISFDYLTAPLPAGPHFICLTIAGFSTPYSYGIPVTTWLLGSTSSAGNIENGNIFYVKEIK